MHYMSKQEVTKLLTIAFENNRDHHLALLLAYATGARVSQILGDKRQNLQGLTGTDVYASEMKIKIHGAKKGKSRFHNLHKDANPIFDLSPLVDLASQRGANRLFGSLTRQYLDLKIKQYGKLAGIHPSLCHMHALRHGIAMIIWDATKRPGAITTFLQHSNASSAYQYLAENDGILADQAVEQYAF
jgi:site-specific recombinase XerD